MRSASGSGVGNSRSAPSIDSPTSTTLLTVPRPGSCRSGIQASRTSTPSDDDDGPDRPPDPARHALMKDVPRIEPEARSHHEGAGRPVQNQANVELS